MPVGRDSILRGQVSAAAAVGALGLAGTGGNSDGTWCPRPACAITGPGARHGPRAPGRRVQAVPTHESGAARLPRRNTQDPEVAPGACDGECEAPNLSFCPCHPQVHYGAPQAC